MDFFGNIITSAFNLKVFGWVRFQKDAFCNLDTRNASSGFNAVCLTLLWFKLI